VKFCKNESLMCISPTLLDYSPSGLPSSNPNWLRVRYLSLELSYNSTIWLQTHIEFKHSYKWSLMKPLSLISMSVELLVFCISLSHSWSVLIWFRHSMSTVNFSKLVVISHWIFYSLRYQTTRMTRGIPSKITTMCPLMSYISMRTALRQIQK
jgi:hypothetical protein